MTVRADRSEPNEQRSALMGRAMIAGAVVCLVAAGLVLWARQGDAVFSDVVLAALAWCF